MFWQIVFTCLVIWLIKRRWETRKLVKLANELKSDMPSLPIIGQACNFIGDDEEQMTSYQVVGREAIKNNGLTSIWIAHILFVVVADPVIAECVLKNLLEKSEIMQHVRAIIGNGSIFAPVSIWRPRRKILAPTFSPHNLNCFVDAFVKHSTTMVDQLENKVGAGPFPIWSYVTTYTMDAVCETTLGVNVDAQKNHNHPFIQLFEKGSQILANRLISPWLHSDITFMLTSDFYKLKMCKHVITDFVGGIIKSKKEEIDVRKKFHEHDCEKETRKSFLELHIKASGGEKGYTDIELREETLVLLMAGTDTSAVGVCFTLLMLARYQDVQDKVLKELEEIFGNSNRPIEPNDLKNLKYLDAVIRESLRLYPPVPQTVRQCDRDYTLPSGVTLAKGCTVLISHWAIHRNPQYWGEDAELFRPERFLDTPFKHPAQFIAFSYGPRNCLGYQYAMMSTKTALANLLRRYRVLPPRPEVSHKPIRLKFDIMMKDVDNFIVELEDRKSRQEFV